jgi:hypothetical protein
MPRDAERARSELEEARLQQGVLLETVEALQAGSEGEAEQAAAGLAARLCAARAREGALERRAGDLLVRPGRLQTLLLRQDRAPGWAMGVGRC